MTWEGMSMSWSSGEASTILMAQTRFRDLWMCLLIRINYILVFFPSWESNLFHLVIISLEDFQKRGGHFIHLKLCSPFWVFQLFIFFISPPHSLVFGSSHLSPFLADFFPCLSQKVVWCYGSILCFGWNMRFSLLFLPSGKKRQAQDHSVLFSDFEEPSSLLGHHFLEEPDRSGQVR